MKQNNDIKKVTNINNDFIAEFIKTCSLEDVNWIMNTKLACIENAKNKIRNNNPALSDEEVTRKAKRNYFGSFRSLFAQKYFPELCPKKREEKQNGMDATDVAILERIKELMPCVA